MSEQQAFDPGSLYGTEWVQTIIRQIQHFLRENIDWIGIDRAKSQRVLDYACGNGTVSTVRSALLDDENALTKWQGVSAARFNEIAHSQSAGDKHRMWAVQGDLSSPSAALDHASWLNFDIAVISMALHHVDDPVDMLKRLCQRLKPGGVLIVGEFKSEPHEQRAASGAKGREDVASHAHSHGLVGADGTVQMVEVIGGQHIWPGFTEHSLPAIISAAGYTGVEVKAHSETFIIPEHAGNHGGEKRLIFAKGLVAE